MVSCRDFHEMRRCLTRSENAWGFFLLCSPVVMIRRQTRRPTLKSASAPRAYCASIFLLTPTS